MEGLDAVMRILRNNHIVHSFREQPKEKDILFGYVTVLVSENPIETREVLYTTKYGWNTVENSAHMAITAEQMATVYVGWLERNGREIIPNHENWLQRIDDLIEEIKLRQKEEPEEVETDEEGNYWASLDELVDSLEIARDCAKETV